jgi:hypothetical protein
MDEACRAWSRWTVVKVTGAVVGAMVGIWLDWSLGFFDGFSIGPPPPPTIADVIRSWTVAVCIWAFVVFESTAFGLAAAWAIIVATVSARWFLKELIETFRP